MQRISLQQGSVLTRRPQGKPHRISRTGLLNPFSWTASTHKHIPTHPNSSSIWGRLSQKKQDITNFVCLLTSVFVFLCIRCCACFLFPVQIFQNNLALNTVEASQKQTLSSLISRFFITCIMLWPYHSAYTREIRDVVAWGELCACRLNLYEKKKFVHVIFFCMYRVFVVAVGGTDISCCCFAVWQFVNVFVSDRTKGREADIYGCAWVPSTSQLRGSPSSQRNFVATYTRHRR